MSPPPMNIGGITGKQAISLTASQLGAITKPITSIVKSQASLAKSSTGNFVKAAGKGVVSGAKSFQTAAVGRGFDKEGLITKSFDDNPLMNMVGDMFGQGKKETAEEEERRREEEKKQIEQAHHDAQLEKLGETVNSIEKIKDTLIVMKGLVDRIEMSVRDSNKISIAEGKRAQRNASRKRMADIEAQRESEKGFIGPVRHGPIQQKPAAGGGGIGGLLSSLGGMFSQIPGFGMISSLFSGGIAGIKTVFSKLFWPVTAILGIISFVDGFMKGYEEGGVGEGVTQGFENLIDNLIDVPLNMLKDLLAWALGALGFDEASEALDGFDFNISGIVRPIIDFFTDLWDTLMAIPENLKNFAAEAAGNILPDFLNPFSGGDEEAPEPPSERGARGTDKRLKESESPAPAPRTSKIGTKKEAKPAKRAGVEPAASASAGTEKDPGQVKKVAKASVPTPKRSKEVSSSDISYKELSNDGELPWRDWIEKFPNFPGEIPSPQWLEAGYRATDRGPHHLSDWGKIADHARQYMKPMSGFMIKKNAKKFGRSPEEHAKIIGQSENLSMNVGGGQSTGAATQIQDAGLEKGATAGAAPVVINNSPVNNNVQNSQSTSAVLAGARNMDSDPSLNVNP